MNDYQAITGLISVIQSANQIAAGVDERYFVIYVGKNDIILTEDWAAFYFIAFPGINIANARGCPLYLTPGRGGAMHEITLCQNAVEIMQQFGQQHCASRITAVWIEIGALSCVEPDAVQFCFALACRETLAEGCTLHLETPEAAGWCHRCQQAIGLLSPGVLRCPHCGGQDVRVVADSGMKIKRIEIE